MTTKEFIMRGQTESGPGTETINLSGLADGHGFHLMEFALWPSNDLGGSSSECFGTLMRSNTAMDPINPDYSNQALIATAMFTLTHADASTPPNSAVINDLVLLTQDLTLAVHDTAGANPVNWQLKFRKVKVTDAAEAVANYNAFSVRDG